MLNAIDRDRYDVIPVGITREGAFVLEADDPAKFALDGAQIDPGWLLVKVLVTLRLASVRHDDVHLKSAA